MTKKKRGRPSKYNSEFCEEVIELMHEGHSMYEVSYLLKVNIDTLHEWMRVHPEFSVAIKNGKAFAQGNWMLEGKKNLYNKKFNYVGWYMQMKNRFGWSDKQETTHNIAHEEWVKKFYNKENNT